MINININSPQNPQQPMQQVQQNPNIVPNPVRKDPGPNNSNLRPDTSDDNINAAAKGKVVSFGTLGSFTYGTAQLVPPPPTQLPPPNKPMSSKDTSYVYKLGKEECKIALEKWAGSKTFRSKKPATEGHFGEVYSFNALEYKLETFNEKRGLTCKFTSCRPGESINAPGSVQYPNLWTMACSPSSNFVNETKRMNYPHTDVLQPCFLCNAYGELKCSKCNGSGKATCETCKGKKTVTVFQQGGPQNQTCGPCNGEGISTCIRCSGAGKATCNIWNGVQVLKWFLEVEVQYVNHVDEYIKEKTELPDELIKTVKGEILHQDEGVQILPIEDSDNSDIVENTKRLINKVAQAYSQERRILQRHYLNCITCAECEVQYEAKDFKFWVYGEEKNVHCPNYPSEGCCTIV